GPNLVRVKRVFLQRRVINDHEDRDDVLSLLTLLVRAYVQSPTDVRDIFRLVAPTKLLLGFAKTIRSSFASLIVTAYSHIKKIRRPTRFGASLLINNRWRGLALNNP